jgi:hypothetical protein
MKLKQKWMNGRKMATSEEKQDTVDALKGPRYYRIYLNGYGGEAAYININKEAYDFWKPVVEEHGDSDLVNYAVNDDPDEYEFEDIESVPESADFLTEDDFKSPWYEAPGEYVHQYGVEYSSARLVVEEVDSDEYMSNIVADVIDGENLQDYLDGIMEANDYEFDLVEADEDFGEEGEYTMQFYSSEKGCFFDGLITTYGDFDPKKLKVIYTEYPNGEDVVTIIEYDGENIDNNGGDTNGKGYSAHLWKN